MAESLDPLVDQVLYFVLQLVADGDLLLQGHHPAQLVDAAPLHLLADFLGVLAGGHLHQRQGEQLVAHQPLVGLLVVDALLGQEVVQFFAVVEDSTDYLFDFLLAFGTRSGGY